jgi:type II secretory pathway predicted ATPase ExeA
MLLTVLADRGTIRTSSFDRESCAARVAHIMDELGAASERRSPSDPAPGVTHLFTTQRAVLNELMTGMDADARWAVLVGPEGSGKSTVVRALLEELHLASTTVASLEGSQTAEVDDVVTALYSQQGIPHTRTPQGDDRSVAAILASQSSHKTPLVVVVDDADALSAASITWLASLAGGSFHSQTACYVVLAGTSKLEETATRAWEGEGSGRASVRCPLRPLTSAETRQYMDRRLGGFKTAEKVSETAIQRIEQYANGRPGLIDALYERAVTLPASRLTGQVSDDAVVEAAQGLSLGEADVVPRFFREDGTDDDRRSKRHVARWFVLAISAATVASLVVYFGPTLIRIAGLRPAAVDRSISDSVRSATPRSEVVRREPGVPTGVVNGRPPASVTAKPNTPGRESRPTAAPRATPVQPTREQISAMIAGAREGDVDELTRLVSSGVPANVRDANGFTPLMVAVANDRVSAARTLLDRGAEINARTRGGITSLMIGIINDRPDAVKLLLERGADINAQSGSGWTALSFAAWKGDDALVRELLSHGAKPNLADKQGWTPLDYATAKDAASDAGEQ